MSDQATYVADLLLEDTLDEIFHGGPSPELAERILRAANGVGQTERLISRGLGAMIEPEFRGCPACPTWRTMPLDCGAPTGELRRKRGWRGAAERMTKALPLPPTSRKLIDA